MTKSARSRLCIVLGVTFFLIGFWTECHSDRFFHVTFPNGVEQPMYSVEITHASWVLMGSGALLALFATTIWIREGSPSASRPLAGTGPA